MEEGSPGPLPVKSINVVFCGESSVGKTSIVCRYTLDEYKNEKDATVGMEHFIWNGLPRHISDVKYEIKLNIWDGGGKEHYRNSLRKLHSMADVLCFTFDLTNTDTLDAVTSHWLETTRWTLNGRTWGNHERRLPVIAYLIGSKSDLVEQRKITYEMGKQIAESHGMKYFETSAKNNQGLFELFDDIIEYAHGQAIIGRDPGYNFEIPSKTMDDDTPVTYREYHYYRWWCCCCRNSDSLFIEE